MARPRPPPFDRSDGCSALAPAAAAVCSAKTRAVSGTPSAADRVWLAARRADTAEARALKQFGLTELTVPDFCLAGGTNCLSRMASGELPVVI
jgi:hypothetical protein